MAQWITVPQFGFKRNGKKEPQAIVGVSRIPLKQLALEELVVIKKVDQLIVTLKKFSTESYQKKYELELVEISIYEFVLLSLLEQLKGRAQTTTTVKKWTIVEGLAQEEDIYIIFADYDQYMPIKVTYFEGETLLERNGLMLKEEFEEHSKLEDQVYQVEYSEDFRKTLLFTFVTTLAEDLQNHEEPKPVTEKKAEAEKSKAQITKENKIEPVPTILTNITINKGTIIGQKHIVAQENGQDAMATLVTDQSTQPLIVGIVSDGCGAPTTTRSHVGATLYSTWMADYLSIHGKDRDKDIESIINDAFIHLQEQIRTVVSTFENPRARDTYVLDIFSATALVIVVRQNGNSVEWGAGHIGDGFLWVNHKRFILSDYLSGGSILHNSPRYPVHTLGMDIVETNLQAKGANKLNYKPVVSSGILGKGLHELAITTDGLENGSLVPQRYHDDLGYVIINLEVK
jgi:hypothetical protein